MKKAITAIVALLCSSAAIYSQTPQWYDLTSQYIVNPNFDNNSKSGWNISSAAWGQNSNFDALEFWYGTFDISQEISVPNGKYRISVQAYFRNRDNSQSYNDYTSGSTTTNGYLYANDQSTNIANIYSESISYNYANNCWSPNRWGGGVYYPNGMESGAHCFEQGLYNNNIEVDVTDGILKFGLRTEMWIADSWCMMDNFKLEYYGVKKNVSSITLNSTAITLVEGEQKTIEATLSPSDATIRALEWSSSDESVASVNTQGKVTALKSGVAEIIASATDGSGVSASCIVTVKKNTATASSLVINEIQSANVDMFVDPSFNYGGWIELYNPTDLAASINGFYVSDDATNLKKYHLSSTYGVIPAKGFKNIWFDHYEANTNQVNFKLDYDGGTIYISDSDGNLIVSQDYPAAIARTSFARTTDGGEDWGITPYPTPQKTNATSTFATERLEAPIVDKDAQLFTGSLTVCVNIPDGCTLKYTTDGTTPTEENGELSATGLFTINQTTTYRFRLFKDGKIPSEVITRSYLYRNRDYDLPIISVVTSPVNLYSDSLGVYVKGVNGRPGNGQSTPCNWNMDWDRPVNFEYITSDGAMAVNQEVDFAMCGGWSRAWTPHSFKLKAAKVYEGRNSINYPFFAEKPYLKHKTLQIRNGGNDTNCRIKDAALQAIISSSGIDVDGQSCQPIVHFINGEYIGLLNMREPNNKHFAYANYGLDSEDIDQFEMSPDSGYCQMTGTEDSFLHWYELSANSADASTYEEICAMVDIDEYINYMATQLYLGGTDWPQNNVKGFKPRFDGGKFRFVLFDLDFAFNTNSPFTTFESKQIYTFDHLYDKNIQITEEIKFVTIFLNMLQNENFRKQFIDTYCLVAGSVFTPERSEKIINEMAERIAPALAFENQSPYNTANQMINSIASRQSNLINALKNYSKFGLSGISGQKVKLSANIDEARLSVNGISVPTNTFDGTLFPPVTVKAEAPYGYRFLGWKDSASDQTVVFAKESSWSYYDQGSLDGANWQENTYTNSSWKSGKAPLGYSTGDYNNARGINTTLDYGTNAGAKRPTYYFRKRFNLSFTPSESNDFTLNITIDDGAVVYVNGTEAARYNMPNGNISFNTYSTTYANGNPDQLSISLPANLFKRGLNLIAVEVHNNSATSTDIEWDASLTYTSEDEENMNYLSTDETLDLPQGNALDLKAIYERIPQDEMQGKASARIRINEISAANSVYVNEYFKKNDWIELYNTTDEPIDVAGMYLSDNLSKPQKFQIPAYDVSVNTIIKPHGHLVIWADKLEAQSQIHASFKLAAEGGEVMITDSEGEWSDTLFYSIHNGDQSVGIYPDGGINTYLMTKPTIGAPNIMNSYAELIERPELPDAIENVIINRNGDLSMRYVNTNIVICDEQMHSVELAVFTATGQKVMMKKFGVGSKEYTASTSNLPSGIYIASAVNSEGEKCVIKFIVER